MGEKLTRIETKKAPSERKKALVRLGIPVSLLIIQALAGINCEAQAPKTIPTARPPISGAPSASSSMETPTITPPSQAKDTTVNIPPKTNQPAVPKNEPVSQKPEAQNLKKEIDQSQDTYTVEANVGTAAVSEESLPQLFGNSIKPLENGTTANISVLFPVTLADNQQVMLEQEYVGVFTDKTNGVEKRPWGKTFTIPKKGTEIICPVENGEVFQGQFVGQTCLFLRFFGPDGAVYYLLIRTKNNESLPFSEITQNAPLISMSEGDLNPSTTNYSLKPGLPITAGTPILKTNVDNQKIDIGLEFSYDPRDISTCGNLYGGYSFLTNKDHNILYLPASPGK